MSNIKFAKNRRKCAGREAQDFSKSQSLYGRARNFSKFRGLYTRRKLYMMTRTSLRSSNSQSHIFFYIFHIFLHISYIFPTYFHIFLPISFLFLQFLHFSFIYVCLLERGGESSEFFELNFPMVGHLSRKFLHSSRGVTFLSGGGGGVGKF